LANFAQGWIIGRRLNLTSITEPISSSVLNAHGVNYQDSDQILGFKNFKILYFKEIQSKLNLEIIKLAPATTFVYRDIEKHIAPIRESLKQYKKKCNVIFKVDEAFISSYNEAKWLMSRIISSSNSTYKSVYIKGKVNVMIHVRNTDITPTPPEYFIKLAAKINDYLIGLPLYYSIFTDGKIEYVKKLVNSLKQQGAEVNIHNLQAADIFMNMVHSDILLASSSSFSLTAAWTSIYTLGFAAPNTKEPGEFDPCHLGLICVSPLVELNIQSIFRIKKFRRRWELANKIKCFI